MSVLLIVGLICTLAVSHAAPWWVTLSMLTWDRRTDRRTLRFPLDAVSVTVRPRPHQQHCRSNVRLCRSNIRLCCHKRQQCRTKFRPLDKVETNWTCSICFDFVERTKFRSALLPKTATMSKQHSTLSKEIVQLVAFDNVAWTLLLVWAGLNVHRVVTVRVCVMEQWLQARTADVMHSKLSCIFNEPTKVCKPLVNNS